MKRIRNSSAAKLIAAVGLIIVCFGALCSIISRFALEDIGAYSKSYNLAKKNFVDSVGSRRMNIALNSWRYEDCEPEDIHPDSGFVFTVLDENGELMYDGLKGRDYIWSREMTIGKTASIRVQHDEVFLYTEDNSETGNELAEYAPSETPMPAPEGESAPEPTAPSASLMVGYLLQEPPEEDTELMLVYTLFAYIYGFRNDLTLPLCIFIAAAIVLLVFLLSAAGHRRDGTLRGSFLCAVPFDLLSVGTAVAVGIFASLFYELLQYNILKGYAFILIGCTLCFAAAGAVTIAWAMTGAVHIKTHNFLNSLLCWRVIRVCVKLVMKPLRMAVELIKGLPLIPKAALITAAILFGEILWMAMCDAGGGIIVGWLFERAILVVLTLYTLLCMKRLLIGGKAIAGGDLGYKIDSAKMYGPLREHAEDLNNITDGLNGAVTERMKSERFRTELITNVSHDIKTPLTSIINYVDLLEKEQPENERMREYLEVLARQSARLKKLIEDLMEASKASTGNISVNPERCIMNVLIDQTAGEYAERLSAKGLELIVSKPEERLSIMADGRHMWRIFDNLLNNICKYAQRGTRVYIDLCRREDKAAVTLRNISENRLSVGADELSMRFVRGDASRNTDGSGLGLSIAESLVRLQNGTMKLTVDGDLFKVELEFPIV